LGAGAATNAAPCLWWTARRNDFGFATCAHITY